VLWAALIAVLGVVIIGSLSEINAQSAGYRRAIDTGYIQMAAVVANASTQTGARLASLVNSAAALPNAPVPETARDRIQQGLDAAVQATSQEATEADSLVPPTPTGTISQQFSAVLHQRAAATASLRTVIDRQLGMTPLPVAGAAVTTDPSPGPPITLTAATTATTQVGQTLLDADADYRALAASVRTQRLPVSLPASVWVTRPTARAPLGPDGLAQLPPSLSVSAAVAPLHQLIISTVSLSPPAVPSGAPGVFADGCRNPQSAVPSSVPTVLTPTGSITVSISVTNCGNVTESGVRVTQTVSPATPAGSTLPPAGQRGGQEETTVSLRSGASVSLDLQSVAVAPGHLYNLVIAIDIPADQADPTGATQSFVLQISS
jgi:hypothetical protein